MCQLTLLNIKGLYKYRQAREFDIKFLQTCLPCLVGICRNARYSEVGTMPAKQSAFKTACLLILP